MRKTAASVSTWSSVVSIRRHNAARFTGDAELPRHIVSGVLLAAIAATAACRVDQDAARYDRLRYEELQKANCAEMAAVLSKPLIDKEPEDYDAVLERCRRLKTLSFEQYADVAENARRTGSWELPSSGADANVEP